MCVGILAIKFRAAYLKLYVLVGNIRLRAVNPVYLYRQVRHTSHFIDKRIVCIDIILECQSMLCRKRRCAVQRCIIRNILARNFIHNLGTYYLKAFERDQRFDYLIIRHRLRVVIVYVAIVILKSQWHKRILIQNRAVIERHLNGEFFFVNIVRNRIIIKRLGIVLTVYHLICLRKMNID